MHEKEIESLIRIRAEVDIDYPGLRVRDLFKYHTIVVSRMQKIHRNVGFKASTRTNPISANAIGIAQALIPETGMQLMTAVDYVRDERVYPEDRRTNPLRFPPDIYYNEFQFWQMPEIIDEDIPDKPPTEDPLEELKKKFDLLKIDFDEVKGISQRLLKLLEDLQLYNIALVGDPVEVQSSLFGLTIKGKGTIVDRKKEE